MNKEVIYREISFLCNYPISLGECNYKNPDNYRMCLGCKFSIISQNKLIKVVKYE